MYLYYELHLDVMIYTNYCTCTYIHTATYMKNIMLLESVCQTLHKVFFFSSFSS